MCKYQIVKIMMDWKRLISAKRFGMEEFHEERLENSATRLEQFAKSGKPFGVSAGL